MCSVDLNISEEHFNIFKLYIMIYYAQHIHQYDSTDNIDTEYSEIAHKFLIKIFFNQTNKHKSFQQQLLLHNTHYLNLIIMKNLILWKKMWNSVITKNLMITLMTQSTQTILLYRISDLFFSEKEKANLMQKSQFLSVMFHLNTKCHTQNIRFSWYVNYICT